MNGSTYICIMETKNLIDDELAEKLERIAFILKTVAHPMRLGIIHLLEQYPKMSVTEICEALGSNSRLLLSFAKHEAQGNLKS